MVYFGPSSEKLMIPPSTQVYVGRWKQVVGSRADDVYCHWRARVRFK